MSEHAEPPLILSLLLPVALGEVNIRGDWRLPRRGPALLALRRGDPLLDLLALQAAAPRPLSVVVEGGRWPRALRSVLRRHMRVVPFEVSGDLGSGARRWEALTWAEHRLIEGGAVALVAGQGRIHSQEVAPLEAMAAGLVARCPSLPSPLVLLPLRIELTGRRLSRRSAQVSVGPALSEVAAGCRAEEVRKTLKDALDALAEPQVPWADVDVLAALFPLAREALGDGPPATGAVPPADFHLRVHQTWMSRPLAVRRLVEAGRSYLDAEALAGPPPGGRLRPHLSAQLLLAVGGLPAALYGWLFHAAPCLCARALAGTGGWSPAWRRLTWAVGLLPLFYVLQAWALAWALGPWRALALVLAAPPAGLWALAWRPLWGRLVQDLRTAWHHRLFEQTGDRLVALRTEVLKALEAVQDLYR